MWVRDGDYYPLAVIFGLLSSILLAALLKQFWIFVVTMTASPIGLAILTRSRRPPPDSQRGITATASLSEHNRRGTRDYRHAQRGIFGLGLLAAGLSAVGWVQGNDVFGATWLTLGALFFSIWYARL